MLTLSKICLFLLLLLQFIKGASCSSAGVARWTAETARWGTLTASAASTNSTQHVSPNTWKNLAAGVVPFAASMTHNGRIFFYFMHQITLPSAALTISQASLEPQLFALSACGDLSSAVDAQDPRCAKLTFAGTIAPCPPDTEDDEDCASNGQQTLFAAHPSMEQWPKGHDFHVHEMSIDSVWMLANFGGGSHFTAEEYEAAQPIPHNIEDGKKVSPPPPPVNAVVPAWNDTVARARWIVHQARWGTVSTTGEGHDNAQAKKPGQNYYFGNIRSTTDGAYCESSTGRPVFQFPNVDPAAQDIQAHNVIALSFTEASIAARVNHDDDTGVLVPCGGHDAGSPLCGQVVLYGHAVAIDPSSSELHNVLNWFKHTHPLAPWLAHGGSHMAGQYYIMHIHKIVILDYFGGYQEVNVGDYLQYNMAEHAGEYCQACDPSTTMDGECSESQVNGAKHKLPFLLTIFSGTCFLFAAAWIGLGAVARTKRSQYRAVVETTPIV